jgi:hypothetical protein
MMNALKLPKAGAHYRHTNAIMYNQGTEGFYACSTPNGNFSYYLFFYDSSVQKANNTHMAAL